MSAQRWIGRGPRLLLGVMAVWCASAGIALAQDQDAFFNDAVLVENPLTDTKGSDHD